MRLKLHLDGFKSSNFLKRRSVVEVNVNLMILLKEKLKAP
jgi:hypothetical protein